MASIQIRQTFEASAERVFDALADQDRMGEWLGGDVRVVSRGADGVVGTVRRVKVGPSVLDEQIVSAERPSSLSYTIVSRVPLLQRHRGELAIEALDSARSQLTWQILLEFRAPLLAHVVLFGLRRVLGRGLSRLARRLAAEQRSSIGQQ